MTTLAAPSSVFLFLAQQVRRRIRHRFILRKPRFYVMLRSKGLSHTEKHQGIFVLIVALAGATSIALGNTPSTSGPIDKSTRLMTLTTALPTRTLASIEPPATGATAEYIQLITFRLGETVDRALRRAGVGTADRRIVAHDRGIRRDWPSAAAGDEWRLAFDANQRLRSIDMLTSDRRASPLAMTRVQFAPPSNAGAQPARLTLSSIASPTQTYWQYRSGRMTPGFFSAMTRAEVPGEIVAQLLRRLRERIDFHGAFQPTDRFHLVFEMLASAHQSPRAGRLLAADLEVQGRWHRIVAHADAGSPKQTSHARLPTSMKISSAFGWRRHPLSGSRRHHNGIDLPASTGTPVLAARDGVVEFAGWRAGYGRLVILRHGAKRGGQAAFRTYYAHLSSVSPAMRPAQVIRRAARIGAVGASGDAQGAHLHFELRIGDLPVDPMRHWQSMQLTSPLSTFRGPSLHFAEPAQATRPALPHGIVTMLKRQLSHMRHQGSAMPA